MTGSEWAAGLSSPASHWCHGQLSQLGIPGLLPSSTHETTSSIKLALFLCRTAPAPHSGDSLDHHIHPLRALQLQHPLSAD
ncbi:hypothetical protein FJTKL_06111 [Diaporthe vaccinii]|uniref:Uncharacterized protein n=1 Tax=Diaporthe vaccinii TaxID=105482 RepID=A0ABR4EXB9_9PEZI